MPMIDVCKEMDQVKRLIKNVLDSSSFHYISVHLALDDLVKDYRHASENYAKRSEMKDIAGHDKDTDV